MIFIFKAVPRESSAYPHTRRSPGLLICTPIRDGISHCFETSCLSPPKTNSRLVERCVTTGENKFHTQDLNQKFGQGKNRSAVAFSFRGSVPLFSHFVFFFIFIYLFIFTVRGWGGGGNKNNPCSINK